MTQDLLFAVTFKHYFEGIKGTSWYFERYAHTRYMRLPLLKVYVQKRRNRIDSIKEISRLNAKYRPNKITLL